MSQFAVETKNLGRTFKRKGREGPLRALDGVNLEIPPGELFGLLGPNGAGKTTLIKILTTLLYPTEGNAFVAGHDVVKRAGQVRPLINMVSGGEHAGYGILKVREQLWMFSQLYGVSTKIAMERIDELLPIFDLEEQAEEKVGKLSTGERQKMNLIRGFICDPKVFFLDEPTLGLDVHVAREIRQYIQKWVRERSDRTMLMTTHYMVEADEMCDRIAIIDQGKVIALDTPSALKSSLGRNAVFRIEVDGLETGDGVLADIPGVSKVAVTSEKETGLSRLDLVLESDAAISEVVVRITGKGGSIRSLAKDEPTLEDVFISLVGRGLGKDA
ncbi:MAG: ATP-binding cassette domain-containing protein [Planctomycetota bacterium]|nr:ATP-binding cassette domain-containing protein [Planctomycetota bacterium]